MTTESAPDPEPTRELPAESSGEEVTAPEPTDRESESDPESIEPEPIEPESGDPPTSSRRVTRLWLAGAVAVTVCLLIVAAGYVISRNEGNDRLGPAPAPNGQIVTPRTVTTPIDGRTEASLHLVSGATVVTVRAADMGDTLSEVTTPPEGDATPSIDERGDLVEVHLVPTGAPGPSRVEIVLSTQVLWTSLRFSGGANDLLVDLTGGTVGEVELAGGATRIELTLPVPDGTVPVRLSDGAGELLLHTPGTVPLQATLSSGAGAVTFVGEEHAGIAPGTVFTPDDWEYADHRYDLESAGVGRLVVTRGDPA